MENNPYDELCAAVFTVPNAMVVEAYSDYDKEPLSFKAASQLSAYVGSKLEHAKGMVFIFVVYPDMGGKVNKRKINLDPKKTGGHTTRYTWDGWGMISVQLFAEYTERSRIVANSKKRAMKWYETYTDFGSPENWDWDSVERHTRRLRRVLKAAV